MFRIQIHQVPICTQYGVRWWQLVNFHTSRTDRLNIWSIFQLCTYVLQGWPRDFWIYWMHNFWQRSFFIKSKLNGKFGISGLTFWSCQECKRRTKVKSLSVRDTHFQTSHSRICVIRGASSTWPVANKISKSKYAVQPIKPMIKRLKTIKIEPYQYTVTHLSKVHISKSEKNIGYYGV